MEEVRALEQSLDAERAEVASLRGQIVGLKWFISLGSWGHGMGTTWVTGEFGRGQRSQQVAMNICIIMYYMYGDCGRLIQ